MTPTPTELLAQAEAFRPLAEGTTPGEWRYRPREFDDWGMVRGPDDHIVALARDGGLSDERDETRHREQRTDPYEANAHLIAAAPTLHALTQALAAALAESLERERGLRGALEKLADEWLEGLPGDVAQTQAMAVCAVQMRQALEQP